MDKCRLTPFVFLTHRTALIVATILLISFGCSEDKCKSSEDCSVGEICKKGKCVPVYGDSETDSYRSDTESETTDTTSSPMATEWESETFWDTSETDSPTQDTESTDSETECLAINLDGETCSDACECIGGTCDNGICCNQESCCNTAADCDQDRCLVPSCDGNHSCNYSIGAFSCGETDDVGHQTCKDGAVCDGEGHCVPVANMDCGFFNFNGYECIQGEARQVCHTSCTDEDADTTCLEGSYCEGGICTPGTSGLENGSDCTEDGMCLSNHCENGYCCPLGECCSSTDDCSTSLCRDVSCSENHQCVYSYKSYGCGSIDDDSLEQCSGSSRCDGLGNCIPFKDCEIYAADPNGTPPFSCDEDQVTRACYQTCEFSSQCAEGFICNSAGECVSAQRLPSGSPCTGNLFCDSFHCINSICCESGVCCTNDDECEGFSCLDSYQCSSSCDDNEALCADGYHCDNDACIADMVNGAGICDEDSDCESGHCTLSTGICCESDSGDCCALDEHCDDEDPCTTDVCAANSTCTNIPKLEGDSCDDGLFCNGEERCDDTGMCLFASTPCPSGNHPCLVNICDEETDQCVETPTHIDEYCSEPLYCLNGRRKVCTETGACIDPNPEGGKPCVEFSDPNPCVYYTCNEESNSCIEHAFSNGYDCDDENPCTGDNKCYNGECVPGESPPCNDADPCTTDTCTNVGGTAVCGTHIPIEDGDPCEESVCYGEDPVCRLGVCIPDSPICNDEFGICEMSTCSEEYYMQLSCSPSTPNTPLTISCGTSIDVDSSVFKTRAYKDYGEECPGEFIGKEAVIDISTNAEQVTISLSNINPVGKHLSLMSLGNWCDELTCTQSSETSMTFSANQGENVVVIDSTDAIEPNSFRITAVCQ